MCSSDLASPGRDGEQHRRTDSGHEQCPGAWRNLVPGAHFGQRNLKTPDGTQDHHVADRERELSGRGGGGVWGVGHERCKDGSCHEPADAGEGGMKRFSVGRRCDPVSSLA